jgi:hypothetical protein
MSTYSVRCRNGACRHRRVTATHPEDYKIIPACESCGQRAGWRIEGREYNKRNLCHCHGPINSNTAMPFPHRTTHPMCDQHPSGFYNQAKRQGVEDHDIPVEYWPMSANVVNAYQVAA